MWLFYFSAAWSSGGCLFGNGGRVGETPGSGSRNVEYEDFKGHKLDRKMLELMRAS
jgi:hypothetical protein